MFKGLFLARQLYELEQMDKKGEVVDPSMADEVAYEWFLLRKMEMTEMLEKLEGHEWCEERLDWVRVSE